MAFVLARGQLAQRRAVCHLQIITVSRMWKIMNRTPARGPKNLSAVILFSAPPPPCLKSIGQSPCLTADRTEVQATEDISLHGHFLHN